MRDISRREFAGLIGGLPAAGTWLWSSACAVADDEKPAPRVRVEAAGPEEDVIARVRRLRGKFDPATYRQLLGAASEFKEGDESLGVAAADDESRNRARQLLARTTVAAIDRHSVFADELHRLIVAERDTRAAAATAGWTMGQLKQFLLDADEAAIKAIAGGLTSDVIGCVVRLMDNRELTAVGAKIFNPLPGSRIGAKGYLGARIQPNSPTDHLDDIRWQVLDGWSYGVGDVLLGTNPVSSDPASVAAVELALKDLLATFGLTDVLPHCVLAHIDVQAEAERLQPGSTALWFQSIAGTDTANRTFDISIEKMLDYAARRPGKFGLYFETGQGADLTNGHGHGFDMVLHESRKYGLARALTRRLERSQVAAGKEPAPWVHLNDVAGFIGPEVFRTREQLVRCCLEDIVMGKLHGLTLGLDVCSTLHMDVSLDDLDWCLDRIVPACPAYLMALPTKIDPMLGYLTTGYQDHVRLRQRFGLRVNDRMQEFFQTLGIVDADGHPTGHFGDPLRVYLQYRRRKGDSRRDEAILAEGRQQMAEVRGRGVFLATGHGRQPWQLSPSLQQDIRRIYADAKQSIRAELTDEFVATVPAVTRLATRSVDRDDYILHPVSGEQLAEPAEQSVAALRKQQAGRFDVQIVVSDGLNALAIMDDGQLLPYLTELRNQLARAGYRTAPASLVVTSGRVRAGYRIGERLFGGLPGHRAVVHVIGERPGTGHHTFSAYLTAPEGKVWGQAGEVDHNITKVVSGIARTALLPDRAATETVRLLGTLAPPPKRL
ncbi:MAG: ethanolamine ammonia-lyase subunit EutB [Planctomycetaceae bacterium]|nr:ethanolamine ammonia-lyase subunit EutB [Planctomycetaceae bacterium]